MAKHTDFGRIGGGTRPASKRRRDARAALFTEDIPAETAALPPESPALVTADAPAPAPASAPAAVEEQLPFAESTEAVAPEPVLQRRTAPLGWFVLECSSCRARSRMGLVGVMLASMPSLHLPFLRTDYPSLMRCPNCQAHRWVRMRVDLDS